MLIGISIFDPRKVPDQHVVDHRLLLVAQTAVIGEKTLDVSVGIASDQLLVTQDKCPAHQGARRVMADFALLSIKAIVPDLQLERLHECADFAAGELTVVIGKEIEHALSAFFPDEFSLFEKECLASKIAGMILMTSSTSGLEQAVRVDGFGIGRWCHRRKQDDRPWTGTLMREVKPNMSQGGVQEACHGVRSAV